MKTKLSLSKRLAGALLPRKARVAVVFDLDAAGREGAAAAVSALRAGGLPAGALELPADLGEHGGQRHQAGRAHAVVVADENERLHRNRHEPEGACRELRGEHPRRPALVCVERSSPLPIEMNRCRGDWI